jgi:hypothetical protein
VHLAPHKKVRPRPASGFYGVSANKKRWQAKIYYERQDRVIGSFDTKQEAALAYDTEARQLGKDRLLNYESIIAAEEAAVQAQAVQNQSSRSLVQHRDSMASMQIGSSGKRGSTMAARTTASAPLTPSRRQRSHTTERQGSTGRTSH